MTPFIISAVLALAGAADKEAQSQEPSDGKASGQIVRLISLPQQSDNKSDSDNKSVAAGGAVQIHLLPPAPPLVAFVQEDGSVVHRHSAEHIIPVDGEKPE